MKTSLFHLKQIRKIFESKKKIKKVTSATITPKETTEKDFVKNLEHFI